MPTLTLVPIDAGNWRIPLSVREDQKHFVSEPMRVLARAYAYRDRNSVAMHIALDGEPIGMLMYHDWAEDECYVLSQFFIDRRWQGRGYGYAAMQLVLDVFRRDGRYNEVDLCCCEGDDAAMKLYEKCGFVPTGEVDEGEVMMRLELSPVQPPRGRNACYTYFSIVGNFDPDEVTRLLSLQPDEVRKGCESKQSQWQFGRCSAYSPYVEEQMRQTLTPLLNKIDLLNRIREEYDAVLFLEIVPTVHRDESTPCLAPPMDVIDFCHATRTQIDIDLYIEGD